MVTLRPYQEAAVRAACDGWHEGLARVVWSMRRCERWHVHSAT